MLKTSDIVTTLTDYSHSMLSKALAYAGSVGAATQLSSSWFDSVHEFLYSFPWMNTLSAIAVILLVIERGFLAWAAAVNFNRERKRKKAAKPPISPPNNTP